MKEFKNMKTNPVKWLKNWKEKQLKPWKTSLKILRCAPYFLCLSCQDLNVIKKIFYKNDDSVDKHIPNCSRANYNMNRVEFSSIFDSENLVTKSGNIGPNNSEFYNSEYKAKFGNDFISTCQNIKYCPIS